MPKMPCCFVCSCTPAELLLFGKPFCEECAHNLVTDAADKTRARLADRARAEPLPMVVRDGVRGCLAGDLFVPCLA